MPYLQQRHRASDELRLAIDDYFRDKDFSGALNYLLTLVATSWLRRRISTYANMSEVIAAFECAKLEFYRRKLAPYEDQACSLNGDVY